MSRSVLLSESERRCVAWLANNCDKQTGGYFTPATMATGLGISPAECLPLLRMASAHGLLTGVLQCDGDSFSAFNISYRAVEFQREIEAAIQERQKADRVEAVTSWFKRNPWTAYPIFVLFVLTLLATLVNQVWDLLVKLGILPKS